MSFGFRSTGKLASLFPFLRRRESVAVPFARHWPSAPTGARAIQRVQE